MTVKEFCESYTNTTPALKEKYIKDNLEVKDYSGYLNKVTYCKQTIKSVYDNESRTDIESSTVYLLSIRGLIELYTNLRFTVGQGLHEEYDLLKTTGILDNISNQIPQGEISEYFKILDLCKEDYFNNRYEPHAFIKEQVGKIGSIFTVLGDGLMGAISEKMKELNLGDVDSDTMKELFQVVKDMSGDKNNN